MRLTAYVAASLAVDLVLDLALDLLLDLAWVNDIGDHGRRGAQGWTHNLHLR